MATLNDVLKNVLEKNFDKSDVKKVMNSPDEELNDTNRDTREDDLSDCDYAYYKLSLGFTDTQSPLYCTDPCKTEGHSCGR